ncbi:MAG: Holliday junction resolvase RuvX [Rubrobacter sp.]|nr:Holliday junction resolvase RuvX [Rubrobacter sp.]
MDDARGRVAALDVGDVWTGVAVSDETRRIARPVEVVGSGDLSSFLENLAREEGVSEVVVGVPKTLRGEVGFQARKILDKLDGLRDEFPEMRFVEWDERFTTRMAAGAVGGADRGKRAKRRSAGRGASRAEGRVDDLAAARMLQEYLESRGNI